MGVRGKFTKKNSLKLNKISRSAQKFVSHPSPHGGRGVYINFSLPEIEYNIYLWTEKLCSPNSHILGEEGIGVNFQQQHFDQN